jgi:DNA-binding response OmpR family regulator
MNLSKDVRILICEDDPNLSMLLCDFLKYLGYETSCAADGKQGWLKFQREKFELCILDVMMPQMDGFALAELIRKRNSSVPIIFLTAKSLNEDRIKGFRAGCDDYITKPFNSEELGLRIEAILKRCGIITDEERYKIGIYEFDVANMRLVSPALPRDLHPKRLACCGCFTVAKTSL